MNPRFRALGRLLVFAALVFIVLPAKGPWLRLALRGAGGTVEYLVDHVIELVIVLAFGSIMAALEHRPFAAFGLPWRLAFHARFWQGAGVALGSLALLVFVLRAAGVIRIGAPSTPVIQAIGYSLAYAAVFALLALREEFLYRGYGLFTLTEVTGFWPAAVASSVWFTWTHADSSGENWLGLASIAAFGLVACLMLRRTGSLWMGIGFHSAWNWGQTFLLGVSDSGHPPPPGHLFTSTVPPTAPAWLSGASAGPEGSALCVVLVAVLGVLLTRILRGTHYPGRA